MRDPRSRPEILSTRMTRQERAIVQAAAATDGVPVAEWLRSVALPEARRRLSRELAGGGAAEALIR